MDKMCETCDGTGWTHVYFVQGRNVACRGKHTTKDERAALGHCVAPCGADECAFACPDCEHKERPDAD